METKHLSYFKVENFKRFDRLEVSDIGQFNLIVGDNNVGKTTFLEALLFDEKDPDNFLKNFIGSLIWRKIYIEQKLNVNYIEFFVSDGSKKIVYNFTYNENKDINELSIEVKQIQELDTVEAEKVRRYLVFANQPQFFAKIVLNKETSIRPLFSNVDKYYPFIGFNVAYGEDLVRFFSLVTVNTKDFESIKKSIQTFIPNLENIEINSALIPESTTLAIREKGKNLIPLSQYGDGVIKLFRFLIELHMCENKRLLIDEIDTGIHHKRMKEFLKQVIQGAKDKNVQLFATTHSKECLEYYTQALQELGYENEGRIIRIADTKSGIKAYTMRFEEFENALEAESEIR